MRSTSCAVPLSSTNRYIDTWPHGMPSGCGCLNSRAGPAAWEGLRAPLQLPPSPPPYEPAPTEAGLLCPVNPLPSLHLTVHPARPNVAPYGEVKEIPGCASIPFLLSYCLSLPRRLCPLSVLAACYQATWSGRGSKRRRCCPPPPFRHPPTLSGADP